MEHNRTIKIASGSLLLALSLLIPLTFGGFLGIQIGPGSATLASHVPTFLAMLYGPGVAFVVGLGSAIGFFMKLGLIIGLRAAMHIIVGVVGAYMLKRHISFPLTLIALTPFHALLESLIVLLFGFSLREVGLAVGCMTVIHHLLDATIAVAVWRLAFYGAPQQPLTRT
ncbi:MAG TPA: ECF transporter S component [Firmicutes bacterium]|nr:ECF transporter S component [Candidatus Fermentithermobacillaceae bacterium]